MSRILDDILRDIPTYSRFLTVGEIDELVASLKEFPDVSSTIIGRTINDEPLPMISVGGGEKTALIIGVPHSDEPLGSLVVTFFARWLACHPEADGLGWRWLLIPILERRGMRLNEGWFHIPESLAAMAKSNFREPTDDQYEWTFPISYEDYKWTLSRPETLAVKKVLEDEKPDMLCNLHHTGFTGAYYYFSEDLPEVYPKLEKFAANLQIPLMDTAPDTPFGKRLHPGFNQMYGLKDYLDYYSKEDPTILSAIKRGACSDEWYQREIGGFSFNCEVPMYFTPKLKDKGPAGISYKHMIKQRYKHKKTRLNYSTRLMEKLAPYSGMANPLLLYSAEKHVANAKTSLEHEKRMLSRIEEQSVINAEKFENQVLEDLFDLFFLGQIWRVAESICVKGGAPEVCRLMDAADLEIKSLAKSIQERGAFYHLPIRNCVKMQLGSILIIAETLRNKARAA